MAEQNSSPHRWFENLGAKRIFLPTKVCKWISCRLLQSRRILPRLRGVSRRASIIFLFALNIASGYLAMLVLKMIMIHTDVHSSDGDNANFDVYQLQLAGGDDLLCGVVHLHGRWLGRRPRFLQLRSINLSVIIRVVIINHHEKTFCRSPCWRERGSLLRLAGNPPLEWPKGRNDVWPLNPSHQSYPSRHLKMSSFSKKHNLIKSNLKICPLPLLHTILHIYSCIVCCVFITSFT